MSCLPRRIDYPFKDQINNCFKFLGLERKNAFDMNDVEFEEAEAEVCVHFEWVVYPGYKQLVPRHKKTKQLVLRKGDCCER